MLGCRFRYLESIFLSPGLASTTATKTEHVVGINSPGKPVHYYTKTTLVALRKQVATSSSPCGVLLRELQDLESDLEFVTV